MSMFGDMLVRKRITGKAVIAMTAVITAVGLSCGAAGQAEDAYTTTAGSGERFQTMIERSTSGRLSQEDLRQVTILGSRLLLHLNHATEYLVDERTEEAAQEIEYGRQLARIIGEMLPITRVRTEVRNAENQVVYEYAEEVQDDQIAIYEATLMIETVAPIVEAKKEEVRLQGLTLQDADFLYTSALLDLSYVERKLNRAAQLLDDKNVEAALDQLVLAQTHGLELVVNREDSPLVKAQAALQLAERMVGNDRVEGAKANLKLAELYVDSYRTLVGDAAGDEIEAVCRKLEDLRMSLDSGGMIDPAARDESRGIIRGLWNAVTGWMTKEPGQVTVGGSEEPTAEDNMTLGETKTEESSS